MKYVINIDEDNPIHADDRETVYMDKDTGMTWTISNNGKKKMIPLERIENDMSDLIDRQAAIDALDRFSLGETDAVKLAFRMGDYLKSLPSAQERKTGRWVQVPNNDNGIDSRCSACHRYRFHNGEMVKKYKFCPNCGCKMEVDE